ncbi:hypothetical protein EYF80_007819 [Liparis tanakae]|uniref:Uncharacterized protein n=1 Tax=Liparis tanakae TaxID=230148 RepID=A0A4Z2IVQ2_9TELE|nr:hypothetical protein EYF80_007819 [Liparis tanakae]
MISSSSSSSSSCSSSSSSSPSLGPFLLLQSSVEVQFKDEINTILTSVSLVSKGEMGVRLMQQLHHKAQHIQCL